jgi:hypothetical protein
MVATRNEPEGALLIVIPENCDRDLSFIVERLRYLADYASIKAAILRLNCEGVLLITPEWSGWLTCEGGRNQIR